MNLMYLPSYDDQKRNRPLPADKPGEVWQSLAKHPGFDISNYGRVRKLHLEVPGTKIYKMRAVTPVNEGELMFSTGITTKRIAYAVLETFVGPRPKGNEVYYLDGDIENCHLTNLSWGPKRHQRCNVTINPEIAKQVRQRLQEEPRVCIVRREFNLSRNIVTHIKLGHTWNAT